jgi:hypothetical protein
VAACTTLLGDYDVSSQGQGDDASIDGPSTSDGGGGDDVATTSDGATHDVANDAPITCVAPRVPCNGACVSLDTPMHCGACGHDCGGGTCMNATCQPMVVAGNQNGNPGILGLAIDGASVYFSSNDDTAGNHLALTCAASGCVGPPKQLASYGQYIKDIVASNGTIVFVTSAVQATDHPSLGYCPETGCVGNPSFLRSGTFSGFSYLSAFGANFDFFTPDNGLFTSTCMAGGASCATPTQISSNKNLQSISSDGTSLFFYQFDTTAMTWSLMTCHDFAACTGTPLITGIANPAAGNPFPIVKTVALGGTVYALSSGQTGGIPGGAIQTCKATGCSGAMTPFVTRQAYPTDVAVDSTGVFWINSDDHAIKTCPITGCVGGPHTVAQSLTAPKLLRTDASFVYWVDGPAVMRVAK